MFITLKIVFVGFDPFLNLDNATCSGQTCWFFSERFRFYSHMFDQFLTASVDTPNSATHNAYMNWSNHAESMVHIALEQLDGMVLTPFIYCLLPL